MPKVMEGSPLVVVTPSVTSPLDLKSGVTPDTQLLFVMRCMTKTDIWDCHMVVI